MVVNDRSTQEDEPGLYPGSLRAGVIFGLAAALCQAIGAVAARHAMTECDALEAAFARLSTSALFCLAILICKGTLLNTISSRRKAEDHSPAPASGYLRHLVRCLVQSDRVSKTGRGQRSNTSVDQSAIRHPCCLAVDSKATHVKGFAGSDHRSCRCLLYFEMSHVCGPMSIENGAKTSERTFDYS